MSRLNIAVAGVGVIGRRHIELIQASAECQLAAVVDPVPLPPEYLAALGVEQYPDLPTLFARHIPDGVILATPNALHVEQALECVHAGMAALIEKPVAHTVDAGRRLCDVAESRPSRLLVGHHRAHSPILRRAREVIRDGLLGDLVAVQGTALYHKPRDYFEAAAWRRLPGGGPILINMIHEIGNLRSLCGEIVAVQALQSNAARGFAVEDTVAVNLRFANGMLGSFLLSDSAGCSRSWEQTSGENASYASSDDEDCYLICGKNGSLAVPTLRLNYYAQPQDASWYTPFERSVVAVERCDPLEPQLAHFCAMIRGEVQPLVTVRDGLRNLMIVEAIAEAARTGRLVTTDGD